MLRCRCLRQEDCELSGEAKASQLFHVKAQPTNLIKTNWCDGVYFLLEHCQWVSLTPGVPDGLQFTVWTRQSYREDHLCLWLLKFVVTEVQLFERIGWVTENWRKIVATWSQFTVVQPKEWKDWWEFYVVSIILVLCKSWPVGKTPRFWWQVLQHCWKSRTTVTMIIVKE